MRDKQISSKKISMAYLFPLVLLVLYLIRLPVMPLTFYLQANIYQGVHVQTSAIWLRIVAFLSQAVTLSCPILMFGLSVRSLRISRIHALTYFGVYAAMELAFQCLYTVLSYYRDGGAVIFDWLLVNLWQWALFTVIMLGLLWLLGELLFRRWSLSDRFFSLRDRDTVSLAIFALLFAAQKTLFRLLPLFQELWLESSMIWGAALDVAQIFVAAVAGVALTRWLLCRFDRIQKQK